LLERLLPECVSIVASYRTSRCEHEGCHATCARCTVGICAYSSDAAFVGDLIGDTHQAPLCADCLFQLDPERFTTVHGGAQCGRCGNLTLMASGSPARGVRRRAPSRTRCWNCILLDAIERFERWADGQPRSDERHVYRNWKRRQRMQRI